MPTQEWETRSAALWDRLDDVEEAEFRALVDALAGELDDGDPVAAFERGCAADSTGHPDEAVVLYEAALAAGLDGYRRRRALIQLSSSLRNLGQPERGVVLLEAERAASLAATAPPVTAATPAGDDPATLDDALVCTLALCLADAGRAREGVGLVVAAMAPKLPRYQRSMAFYGKDMAGLSQD
ncbi:tetratricopeptide repeat protein [Conexibacter woesei]|uniref:tetratricopeptide repeat protein n=1 Tax=Conexibacter woesei TaxID=191495 RepID=UPI00047D25A4|nr:tetratricopeptide repeat protein [Conexibacter woesei]